MAHGFVSYSKPNPSLNIGAMIAGKVKDSFGMAAEERKAREEEIKNLKSKDEELRTDEESQRLEFLISQDKERKEGGFGKSFFAKSLMSQFGGDRKRRLEGTFSKKPKASQDPALSKEERFSALLDEAATPAEEPETPTPVDDLNPMDYGDANAQAPTPQQSTLQKLVGKVSDSLSVISTKLSALSAEEKKSVGKNEETNARLNRFAGVFEAIKNYFDKDNDLKKQEGSIEQQKLDNFRESQADAKASAEQAATDKTEDLSSQEDQIDARGEGKQGGGLLGKMFDGIKGLFGGKKGGGVTPQSKAYSSPIGPQPMNSASPWAKMGSGDRGGMFGGGQFTPRLPATKLSEGGVVPGKIKPLKKLSEGAGIVTEPTTGTLSPGSSVIPLNRNNAIADTFQQAKESAGDPSIADPMAQVMQLPSQVGGGLLIGLLSKAMSSLGGIAGMLKPAIQPILNTLVPAFGLPATVAAAIFGGGPAAAATLPFDMNSFMGDKESQGPGSPRSGPGSPGSGPPIVPTGNLTAAPTGNETGIQSLSGGTPTSLAAGSTIANTQLHHGDEDVRRGLKVRDYFIGGPTGPSDGSDGLGAKLYTPLGYGPLKYKKLDNHGITFHDPQTDEKVGMYYHVNSPQHQLDGQIVQPGTLVGTQGGLPGTSSAYPGSTAVHLHVEGTDRFHNAVIATYAGGNILNAPGVEHTANQQTPQPAGARPQLGAANQPVAPAASTSSGGGQNNALLAIIKQNQQAQQQASQPVGTPSLFSIVNPSPGWASLYGTYQY